MKNSQISKICDDIYVKEQQMKSKYAKWQTVTDFQKYCNWSAIFKWKYGNWIFLDFTRTVIEYRWDGNCNFLIQWYLIATINYKPYCNAFFSFLQNIKDLEWAKGLIDQSPIYSLYIPQTNDHCKWRYAVYMFVYI